MIKMTVFSVHIDATIGPNIKRFTAPTGKVYEINSVDYIPIVTGSNRLLIFDRLLEEPEATYLEGDISPFFFANMGEPDYQTRVVYNPPIRTKSLTIDTVNESVAATGRVIVNYRIESANTQELIWEFVKRGKNP